MKDFLAEMRTAAIDRRVEEAAAVAQVPQTNLNPEAATFYPRRQVEERQDEEDDAYLDFYDLKPLHMEEAAGEVGPEGEHEYAVTETDDESLTFDATDDEM